jgi:hypothetical protein
MAGSTAARRLSHRRCGFVSDLYWPRWRIWTLLADAHLYIETLKVAFG